jgi:hypothetical protein
MQLQSVNLNQMYPLFGSVRPAGLSARGVDAFVTRIQVSGGDNTVWADVSAHLSVLFPSVVPKVVVIQSGVAKLRALTH